MLLLLFSTVCFIKQAWVQAIWSRSDCSSPISGSDLPACLLHSRKFWRCQSKTPVSMVLLHSFFIYTRGWQPSSGFRQLGSMTQPPLPLLPAAQLWHTREKVPHLPRSWVPNCGAGQTEALPLNAAKSVVLWVGSKSSVARSLMTPDSDEYIRPNPNLQCRKHNTVLLSHLVSVPAMVLRMLKPWLFLEHSFNYRTSSVSVHQKALFPQDRGNRWQRLCTGSGKALVIRWDTSLNRLLNSPNEAIVPRFPWHGLLFWEWCQARHNLRLQCSCSVINLVFCKHSAKKSQGRREMIFKSIYFSQTWTEIHKKKGKHFSLASGLFLCHISKTHYSCVVASGKVTRILCWAT